MNHDDAMMNTCLAASSTETEPGSSVHMTESRHQTERSAHVHTAGCQWNLPTKHETE